MDSQWSTRLSRLVLLDAKPRTIFMQDWSMVKNVGVEMPLRQERFLLLLLTAKCLAWATQPSTAVETRG